MDDRTKASELATPAPPPFKNGLENKTGLIRRFPTITHLRRHAPRHAPRFAFEYMDGGAGGEDAGIRRNWAALDAIELVPRYGITTELPPVDIELFGRRYAAPIGVAPMGGPSIVWPGADEYLAAAAQAARVPYVLGTVGGTTIENAAKIAPDVLWFQLYRMARNDHAIGFDLVRRADAAGAHVLVLTVDVPVRTTRAREVAAGVTTPFRPDLAMHWDIATSPGWLAAMLRNGIPRFANLRAYTGSDTSLAAVAQFARREVKGAFTWDEIARYRERWKRPLVLKGILHPDDAETAIGARRRRHHRVEPWRAPGRGAAGRDRRAAGNRRAGRRPRHRDDGFRRAQRRRRRAGARARRPGGVRRQGLPVGARRARQPRARARDRPPDRRDPGRTRPDRRAPAGRGTQRRGPPPRGIEVR